MKIAIVQFPGSNCERESILAIKRAGMEPVEFLWNEPADKLQACNGYFLVGGFAYEDRSRAGIIASLDSVMRIIREESEKGKPVLGICNGAQILVETGLVPSLKDYRVGMALATNRRVKDGHVLGTGYYNAWANVQLTAPSERNAFTRHLEPDQWMTIPIAHAEGRFMMPSELLDELRTNDQTVFRYCDDTGNTSSEFPINPNGSMDNLAAVCNPTGNVLAMMPHPERTTNGDPIFTSMRDYIKDNTKITVSSLSFKPPNVSLSNYIPQESSIELLVDLIITDNEAVSVENALRQLGLSVTITRQTHWEVVAQPGTNNNLREKIISTGELFNSNKEILTVSKPKENATTLLVRYKDDIEGQHKCEALKNWFHIDGIHEIKRGVLWTITSNDNHLEEVVNKVLDTHILYNPYSHNCFYYG
ncbi:MAG: phosphoribosylformylglycinamidine synthase I [Candidatus Marinimicrobia bacterium]|nr:phosphoribosylformylglycinamidine synthase I [Candidatus Neomarinimicrobiota bacterium]